MITIRLQGDRRQSAGLQVWALGRKEVAKQTYRSKFIHGRAEIVAFPTRKWAKELQYRLIKELWAFAENRTAVRLVYEWHDDCGNWFRSYGNENWEFVDNGLMQRRLASNNDLPIKEAERKYHWDRSAAPSG